jgi:putative molybdopterin biosynthesis protein
MKRLLSTKEVAQFLDVNEKMVYTLIAEKGLPASKITGKWLFPIHLVEQWIETHTVNYPEAASRLPAYQGLLIITGSNDLLLDKAMAFFNAAYPDQVVVFGNLGSMGGLRALRQNCCHIAASHLLQENEEEYNFDFAVRELSKMPVVVNFCRREQGLLVQSGNPKGIGGIEDLGRRGITIVNRALGTGTRLLLDRQLVKAGLSGDKIQGYQNEVNRHLDVGLEVLAGRADAGPGIRPVASLLGLDFIPLRWERYDLLITKEHFFDQGVQQFLGLLHEKKFQEMADALSGYDLSGVGRMVFPPEPSAKA